MTCTPRRPGGIKGGPHLLTRFSCPCLKQPKQSQCSCPYCSHFIETSHVRTRKHLHRGRPRTTAAAPRPAPCDRCAGICNRPDSFYRIFLADPIGQRGKMFCESKEIAQLNLIDPDSGLLLDEVKVFTLHSKDCMLHKCVHCGWNQRFSRLPLLTAVFDRDEDHQREVKFRGCPHDCHPRNTIQWNEFRKIEHGLCASGKPYVTDTWVPVEGTRLQFHGRMHEFYLEFWPHQWSLDLNQIVRH